MPSIPKFEMSFNAGLMSIPLEPVELVKKVWCPVKRLHVQQKRRKESGEVLHCCFEDRSPDLKVNRCVGCPFKVLEAVAV